MDRPIRTEIGSILNQGYRQLRFEIQLAIRRYDFWRCLTLYMFDGISRIFHFRFLNFSGHRVKTGFIEGINFSDVQPSKLEPH